MELVHRMSEVKSNHSHLTAEGDICDGGLERLISAVGINAEVGTKGPSDNKLQSLGFTKYVRGAKGYEKQFGNAAAPGHIDREK